MERKTRWIQPWTGLCPVCGNDAKLDTRKASITYWLCNAGPCKGRVTVSPMNETTIYLDNPEEVYKDYPKEKFYGFTVTNGEGKEEDFEIRESHLTQQQENMLVANTIEYVNSMPPLVRKRVIMGL